MLHTFSIVAADVAAREVGVAVQSKFLAVGSVVPWVDAGGGGVATQAWANAEYGPDGLALLRAGRSADEVVRALTGADEQRDDRQLGVVDVGGRAATFTGTRCIEWAGGFAGDGFAAQGNCLAGAGVVDAMVRAYETTRGTLADRLVTALAAGQRAGGDKRGQQSAALLIAKPGGGYGGKSDRYVDLRVDDHSAPIGELARILELHKLYNFPALPEDVIRIDDAVGAEIAALLMQARALPSSHAAAFDDAARAALVAFMHVENLENRVRDDGAIDRQTLDYLRSYVRRTDLDPSR